MIYHLMKRDPAWRFAPYFAVTTGVLWLLLSSPGDEPSQSFIVASVVYMACNLILRVHERCSLSAAALPIEGRQLFLARLLSLLTFVWLPVVAATAVANADPTGLTAAAAVSTVAVLCAQSVRVREISAPPWLATIVGPVLIVAGGVLFYFSAQAVLIVGAVISVILLVGIWTRIPKSFQVAPPEALSRSWKKDESFLPTIALAPGIRSLFTWQGLCFFPVLLIFPTTGSWIIAAFFVPTSISQSNPGLRWLFSLPISRRKLLWSVLIPPLALLTAGCAFRLGSLPLRMRILTASAALLVSLFSVFSIHIIVWSRLRGVSRAVRVILSTAGLLAVLGLGVADIARGALAEAALIRIGGILPDNLLALTAVLAAVVGAAYWVVEKQFSEIEAQMFPARAKYT